MVIEYVKVLLTTEKCKHQVHEHDIGVVTPYKLQADKIRARFEEHLSNDISIGTAAVFQGQEKQIMIVSLVSVGNVSEFAANFRRINVMLTRAKSLLIIIGHGATVQKNKNWQSVFNYCESNGSVLTDNYLSFQ